MKKISKIAMQLCAVGRTYPKVKATFNRVHEKQI